MRPAAAVAALLAAAPAAAPAAWWERSIHGNGVLATERRDVHAFTAVRLEGSLDVSVRVGPERSVVVKADENVVPHVVTRLDGETLVIRLDGEVRDLHEGSLVEVATPELRRVEVHGSGDVDVEGSKGGEVALAVRGSGDVRWSGEATRLTVSVDGSGDVTLAGRAGELAASVNGSGDIRARKLVAVSAETRTAGSGDVELTLGGGTLRASTAGSGDVRWWGDAKVERASVAGSGEIVRRGVAR